MTVLLDNRGQGKVGDVLRSNIQKDARLSILTGLFSIYGYDLLKKQLGDIGSLRLLIPSNNTGRDDADERLSFGNSLTGNAEDRRFRNTLNMTAVARECAQCLQEKAEIKAVFLPINQNL